MNGLLIAVCVIFVCCMIVGYVRGFIKIVASLAATLAIIVLVMFISPYVSKAIQKTVPLEGMVKKTCLEALVPGAKNLDEEEIEALETRNFTREEQIGMIESSNLPEVIKQLLLENNNGEIYEMLNVDTFVEYVAGYLAKLIADIVAFLLTFLLATIVIRTILYMLGIISDLPVIGGLNRLAGAGLGLGTGLIIVWILFVTITLLYDTNFGRSCFENIKESAFLTTLYDSNLFLGMLTKF